MAGYTGFSSEIGTKLRDWAVGQTGGSCYSRAALSSNDSKTQYNDGAIGSGLPRLSENVLDGERKLHLSARARLMKQSARSPQRL